MSDQFVLILVIIGGATGLVLVVVALFMMRQESAAAPNDVTPITSTEPAATVTPLEVDSAATPIPTGAENLPDSPPAPVPTLTPQATPSSATSWLNSLAARPAQPTGPAPLPPLAGALELVRLWRSAQGELIVEVNGKRHRTRQDLIDAGVEARVNSAISDLGLLLSGPASASVSTTIGDTLPQSTGPSGMLESLINPSRAERPVQKVSLEEASKIEIKKPTMDVSTQLKYLRNQQKTPEIQVKSVAEEINDILQGLIFDNGYSKRGLKIADSLHGVSFSLDGRNYESVDTLPEEEARDFVRQAIQRWDSK
jgi:hypothetical protein